MNSPCVLSRDNALVVIMHGYTLKTLQTGDTRGKQGGRDRVKRGEKRAGTKMNGNWSEKWARAGKPNIDERQMGGAQEVNEKSGMKCFPQTSAIS